MRHFLVACLAIPFFWTAPAFAWNNFGHMEVAAFAWDQLTPATKAKVASLLQRNPKFDDFTDGVDANDKVRIAFILAATWPDIIKRDPDYHNDGAHNGDVPPPGPDASRNIGYTDKLRHKYWHFVDTPFSPDATPTTDAPVPNAQTEIPILRAALADPNSDDGLKSFDMVWLLHLVGDVHQPLHSAQRFTAATPDGDAGGNAVKVHCNVGSCHSANELHAFWDNLLGPSDGTPQAAAAAAKQLDQPDAARAAITDETIWISESFEAAKKFAYHSPTIGHGAGPFQLSQKYQDDATNVAKERVALAGARLANLLNAALQ
jgi:hypothetical protein